MSANPNRLRDKHYPEQLSSLAAFVAELLQTKGMEEKEAADLGFEAAEHVRKNFSGQPLYWPKGVIYESDVRSAQIYDEFNGRNVVELAKKYNLTKVRIYQIIRRVHDEQLTYRQPDMFRAPVDDTQDAARREL